MARGRRLSLHVFLVDKFEQKTGDKRRQAVCIGFKQVRNLSGGPGRPGSKVLIGASAEPMPLIFF